MRLYRDVAPAMFFASVLALAILLTILGCGEETESPTEPGADAALATTATVAYRVVSLSSLGGVTGEASDMNLAGQIVGYSQRTDGRYHAFLWQNGLMRDLGALSNPRRSGNASRENSHAPLS
jgi:probable HAF family extracellular repeat protein